MPNTHASPDAQNEAVDRLSWGLSVLAVLVGAAIIGCHIESGPRRWGAASWQFALHVPGAPATWGVVALAAGMLMLYGKFCDHRRAFRLGSCIAFAWFIILCGAALLAIFDPAVNPLSPITWGAIAFAYALVFRLTKAHR